MMFPSKWATASCAVLAAQPVLSAVQLDLSNPASIKAAASTVAYGMMNYYKGNVTGGIPGLLPGPYYWWEAGAMFGALIDYWYYTGDTTYNQVTTDAMLFQVGPDDDYMPPNQTRSLGNDDQSFWGMAAMSAAEAKFPNPPADQPQWLALAQAVFNTQMVRWDTSTCGGGLRWQIFTLNNGYNYKNTISNGCYFNLAARLYAYTGNETYFREANKTWDWVQSIGLMGSQMQFYDGSDDTINCTQINHIQWTYNAGVFLYGAAIIWNATGSPEYYQRVQDIWKGASVFFSGDSKQIMYEVACEPRNNCDTDQLSFKAYLARWMAATIKVAPFMHDQIMPYLAASAQAAATQCNAGADGNQCGSNWLVSVSDGNFGVGQQMSALEVIQSNLIDSVAGPVTNTTGGISKGDYSAGTGGSDSDDPAAPTSPITTGDRAGAGILTALILVGLLSGAGWMVHGEGA